MAKFVSIIASSAGTGHIQLASEAIKKTADFMGHQIALEIRDGDKSENELTQSQIDEADVVLLVADVDLNLSRFAAKPQLRVSTSKAIMDTQGIFDAALALTSSNKKVPLTRTVETPSIQKENKTPFIVAITSCPTGIAHTFMAANALTKAAEELGYKIRVETRGSVGAKNSLTEEEIKSADAVVIAADTAVDTKPFEGKRLLVTSTSKALHEGKSLLNSSLALELPESNKHTKKENSLPIGEKKKITGPYKHLMTGISYMIPFVVAGGLLIAIGFAIGGIYVFKNTGSFGETLFSLGKVAFSLMLPILGAFISYSIAERPGIVPGMIGGLLASTGGSGFIGAMIAGFAAGYLVLGLKKIIRLPESLEGLLPVLILPILSAAIIGLLMHYVIGTPMTWFNTTLTDALNALSGGSAVVLGIVLGLMMCFDLGGPVNKAAYAFGTATIAAGHATAIMAAVMVSGMVPPLALALSTLLSKNKYSKAEREAGKAAWALGLSFISEGAIPFAAADPFRVIPSVMLGGAIAGGISMAFASTLAVPHGGIWVLFIPHVVTNLLPYIIALVIGTVVSALALSLVKKPLPSSI